MKIRKTLTGGKWFRTKAERRQIAEETLKPGASVSQVARSYDVNANQVFQWRQQYRWRGPQPRLLPQSRWPVTDCDAARIEIRHIDSGGHHRHRFGTCAGTDRRSRRSGLRPSCAGRPEPMIALRTGTHIWISAGSTDLRRGFTGLSALVQTVLEENPSICVRLEYVAESARPLL